MLAQVPLSSEHVMCSQEPASHLRCLILNHLPLLGAHTLDGGTLAADGEQSLEMVTTPSLSDRNDLTKRIHQQG